MKFLFQLCCILLGFSSLVNAQSILDKKITVHLENTSYKLAISEIKKLVGIEFAYNDDALPIDKKVTLQFDQIKLRHVLYYLLEDTDLSYKFIGDQIILYKFEETLPKKLTINGYVLDSLSGEKIIGANIYLMGTNIGTTSNLYGFYSITYYPGDWVLATSYLGFKQSEKKIHIETNRTIDVRLHRSIDLQEVIVTADFYARRQVGINTAWESFTSKDIEMIPAVGGEQDIIKLIQNLPGVLAGTDGLGGLQVRGGDPGQNLVLLDGVQVYNPFHTAGFFSIYNPSAVKSVRLYKSGFPARFSGLTSSVLDVRTKEGNNQNVKAEGGISLLALNGTIEGPIKKGKSSYFLTARRTHIDPWLKSITQYLNQRENKGGFTNYYFYDINAKCNFNLSRNDNLYFSFYSGRDNFMDFSNKVENIQNTRINSNSENLLDWGNDIGTIRWNKLINNKLFANTTLNYSNFKYNSFNYNENINISPSKVEEKKFDVALFKSNIRDLSIKTDFDFIPTPVQKLKAGFGVILHKFEPVVFNIDDTNENASLYNGNTSFSNLDTLLKTQPISAIEVNNYLEDEIIVNDNIIFNLGLNTSFFSVQNINYLVFQPRISLNFILNDHFSIFLSHDNLAQNLHLLSNSGFGLPNDFWIPSTANIGPLKVKQTTLGFHYRIGKNYELKMEAYFKEMKNLVAFQEGASFSAGGVIFNGGFIDARNWEDKISQGEGVSKGIELSLKKNIGSLTGWISYSYANAERQFQDRNYGRIFPYRYDRRHTLNLVGVYVVKTGIELLANFTFGTGQPFSYATSKYYVSLPGSSNPIEVLNWNATNSSRLESYHRLDIGANFINKRSWGEETISIGITNVYNRKNTLFVKLEENPSDPFDKNFVKNSLLPILPSVSYKIRF